MAFTDSSDLYAAVNEEGVNLVARHVMRQRPSLFNYATAYVAARPKVACAPVEHTKDVEDYDNPLFTVVGPLPFLGADSPPVAINFSAQLVEAAVDFHPGGTVTLPAELNPPLAQQRLALHLRVCAGLDCPIPELIEGIQPWPPSKQPAQPGPRDQPPGDRRPDQPPRPPPPPIVPPTRGLTCFCLDAYAIGHVEVIELFGKPRLLGHVDSVDIVDIQPEGLEDALNCYLKDTAELLLKEKLTFEVVKTFFFDFDFLKLPAITVQLAPNPPVPDNPALEDDQFKVFIDIEVGS
jgi:hypothetical protein